MGKIYYIMGKSASGKDTIYQKICEKYPSLQKMIPYTNRPKRDMEEEGRDYHFVDNKYLQTLEEEGKIIEKRVYQTVYGEWIYATGADMDPKEQSYIGIGTLESYVRLRDYYGADMVCPMYIEVETGLRLERALARERMQKEPKYTELCRRFLADEEDFAIEKLRKAGIEKIYHNIVLDTCIAEMVADMENEYAQF